MFAEMGAISVPALSTPALSNRDGPILVVSGCDKTHESARWHASCYSLKRIQLSRLSAKSCNTIEEDMHEDSYNMVSRDRIICRGRRLWGEARRGSRAGPPQPAG